MYDTVVTGSAVALMVGVPVVTLVVFLVVRWFWLWYWRVNRIVGLLERIAEGVERNAPGATWQSPAGWRPAPAPAAAQPKAWRDAVLDKLAGVP
jgi:hypothetical protein